MLGVIAMPLIMIGYCAFLIKLFETVFRIKLVDEPVNTSKE
jgi:hypothetical protein